MVEEEPRAEVDELNEKLKAFPYKLAVVDVKDLEFLQKNARYMTNEMYRNLVDNIKKDGGLSSVPFCWKHDGKYRVLSGNHRSAAAIDAGMKEILVMYTDKDLSNQEQIAIELSHNAIDGKDDMAILKELWDEIEDVGLKYYAGLDDKTLDEMEKVALATLSEVKLDFRSLSFLFLPHEVERMNKAFEQAAKLGGLQDTIYVNRIEDFKNLLNAQAKVQASFDVKNSATALMIILDIFKRHEDDLKDGYIAQDESLKHKGNVPISSILGKDYVSAETALKLKKAVDKMKSRGEIDKKNLVDFIQKAAEKYLDGE